VAELAPLLTPLHAATSEILCKVAIELDKGLSKSIEDYDVPQFVSWVS